MAPHGTRRGARRVHEHRVDARGAQWRRLKIGGDAPNRHSRPTRGIGEPTHAFVARVSGDDSPPRHFERDGFTAGCGAGVVHLRAWRDRGEAGDERVGGILHYKRALGVAR